MHSLVVVVTLAVAIGANSALFSVLHSVVLSELPYPEADRIFRAWTHRDEGDVRDFSFRVAELEVLAGRTGTFSAVGAEFPFTVTVVTPSGEPTQIGARMITAGFFDVFGVQPALGRLMSASEIASGDALVTVVSHEFWTNRLTADPTVVGSTIKVGGDPFEVIGVLPRRYRHVSGSSAALFVPFTLGTSGWIGRWLDVFVKTRPNVTEDRAAEEVGRAVQVVADRPGDRRSSGWTTTIEPLQDMVIGEVDRLLWLIFGAVVVLLGIASVNVANLSLVRGVTRLRELRVRVALGAGRSRLTRQLILESLVLAGLGGLAGLVIGSAGVRALVAMAPPEIPRLDEVALDPIVTAFTAAVTLAAGIVFGVMPALHASRLGGAAQRTARGVGAGAGSQPLIRGLVVTEVALALTLTLGAALLVRTVETLRERDAGFDPTGLLTFRISIPSARYPSGPEVNAFLDRYVIELEGLPGVRVVGAGGDLPFSGRGSVATLRSEQQVRAGDTEGFGSLQLTATPGLFSALQLAPIEGRVFDGTEDPDGPGLLVVSESLARRLFPTGPGAGQRVTFRREPSEDDWLTVIGVVPDVQYLDADADMEPQLYQAHLQSPLREAALIARTAGDPDALIEPARAVLGRLDSTIPTHDIATMTSRRARTLARRTFALTLFTIFASVATLLAAGGIYATLAFGVSRRSGEIGVRMALGAAPAQVIRQVVRESLAMVATAIPLALVGAFLTQRAMAAVLFGAESFALDLFFIVSAGALIVAGVASWWPARQAATIDPGESFRST